MSCNYQKSCVEVYNNTPTTINPTVNGGVPAVFGNTATRTGCSMDVNTNGVTIEHGGLYEFAFDASYLNGATAGTLTAQLYKDGSPVGSALANDELTANGIGNMSFSTRLKVPTCCAVQPVFTVVFTGTLATAVTIQHVVLGVTRLA